MVLLDMLPPPVLNPIGIGVAIGFVFILIAVAFVAFILLKHTLKMAFRMTIVAIIFLIAITGGGLLFLGFGTTQPEYHRPQYPINRNSTR